MNDSQSSDIFSVNTSFSFNDNEPMDTITYESIIFNIKKSLALDIPNQVKNIHFHEQFSTVLEDCSICINQSLDLIILVIESGDGSINSLCDYLNNCVSILQLLSNFIKNVVECVSMDCHSMKTFPITTAQIILLIFKHCKESESLYGSNLVGVQTQLKDIFRSCHELQLTYLMLLDKHFVFDLSEVEEMEIFMQALDINLKIGELVQSLDVKTMAEQWKGISLVCEKYANSLVDKHVLDICSSVLCKIIINNLEIALQVQQEDKVILRSLKVSCFAFKILIKLSNTLKHARVRDHKEVLDMLCLIYLQNPAFIKITKLEENLCSLIKTHVTSPADVFIKDLILDEQFLNNILNYDWIEIKNDNTFLGYILLLTNVIKHWLQLKLDNQVQIKETYNIKLIKVLLNCIPFCQHWFNKQLEFTLNDQCVERCGLYKYKLIHTYSLCLTLNERQYLELEQIFYEVIMSVDTGSALFVSNLWILLASKTKQQTTLSQLITLINTYQKLENYPLFCFSPQEIHLRYILKQLFDFLDNNNKKTIYKEFNINDDKNIKVWSILEIKNVDISIAAENNVLETLRSKIQMMLTEKMSVKEITDLVKVLNLASTCGNPNDVKSEILQLWMKMCPERGFINFNKDIDQSNLWYFQLFQALVTLTYSVEESVWQYTELIKIFHTLGAIIETENVQLSLLATEVFYKLTQYEVIGDELNPLFDKILTNILNDDILTSKLIDHLKGNANHIFLSKLRKEKYQRLAKLLTNHSGSYETILQTKFKHKCIKYPQITEITRPNSSNFEFDIDSILDMDTSEPKCKKQKTQSEDIDDILTKIENETSRLYKINTNELRDKHKMKIKSICSNLNSIVK